MNMRLKYRQIRQVHPILSAQRKRKPNYLSILRKMEGRDEGGGPQGVGREQER